MEESQGWKVEKILISLKQEEWKSRYGTEIFLPFLLLLQRLQTATPSLLGVQAMVRKPKQNLLMPPAWTEEPSHMDVRHNKVNIHLSYPLLFYLREYPLATYPTHLHLAVFPHPPACHSLWCPKAKRPPQMVTGLSGCQDHQLLSHKLFQSLLLPVSDVVGHLVHRFCALWAPAAPGMALGCKQCALPSLLRALPRM